MPIKKNLACRYGNMAADVLQKCWPGVYEAVQKLIKIGCTPRSCIRHSGPWVPRDPEPTVNAKANKSFKPAFAAGNVGLFSP